MRKFILFLFAVVFTATAFSQKTVLSDGNGINNPVFTRTQNVNTNHTPEVSEYYVSHSMGTAQETEAEILADANWCATHAPYSSTTSTNAGARGAMADIIPTAGAIETFTPAVGDNFFDPGGPGANYPNCGCDTVTTLDGATEVDFLDFEVFATFDYLIIYDSADTTGTILFDNSGGGINDGDITLTDMIASNGSSTFTGTSGSLTFFFHSSTVVNRLGWNAEIMTIAGGGGTGNACQETNPSNAFEDGLSSAHIANDVTVNPDEDFSLEQISTNWFSFGAVATVDVYYYADAAGYPGTQIGSQIGVVPTSQDVIGSNFGIDVREVILDVTPFMLNGQTGVPTTYWIEVLGAGAYWEMTSASSNGNPKAFSSDGVTWDYWDPNMDGVYTFSGACTPYIEVVPVTETGLYALGPWSASNNVALYDYDPITDAIALDAGFVGSTGFDRNFGFDFNIQDNRVYLLGGDPNWPYTPRNLYSYDVGADATTLIAQMISVGGDEKAQDLTFGGDGTLYVLFKNGEINSYDMGTQIMSAFANVPTGGAVGLTYDYDNNQLIYAVNTSPIGLYSIDVLTASVAMLFQFDTPGISGCSAQGIEYVGNNKAIATSTFGCNIIYTVDLATQATSLLLNPTGSYSSIKDLMYKGNSPIISCPDDVVADSDPDICGAVVNFADASAIDLEDGPVATTQTIGPASGSVFPIGDTIIEFSATDSFGYTSTCQFTVTVNDIENPMAMCQDITIELDATGMVAITEADIDNGSTDNCGGFTMALDVSSFDCSNVGPNTVTLTVTDASGLTDSCTATVTVEDNQAPVVICQGGGGDNTLTTSFAGGTTGPNGMMFDVMAINTLTVNSFDVNLDATGVTIDVYAKSGTWVGSENNSADWTLIGSVSGMTGTSGTPTPLNLSLGYAIPAGELHAFYVVPQTGNFSYTPGTAVGNLLSSDTNLEIYEGCAKRLPIDGGPLWEPRNFNGSVIYGMSTLPPLEVVLDADGMVTVDAMDLVLSVDDNCSTVASFGGAGVPGSLTTTFAGGNGFFGNMFDIMAINNLTVDSFDVHLASGTSDDVEVYFKTGTYVGSETNPADWTLLDTAVGITSAGDGVPTPLNLALGQVVAAGETVAFYVTIVNAGTMSYTNGTTTGALFASDDNLEFYEGAGGGYFDVNFNPRVFNGNILYSTGGGTTMDLDCSNLGENMIDVTVTDAGGNEAMCTATVVVLDETAPVLLCEDKDIELGPDGTTTIDPYDLMANLPSTYEVMVIGSDNASGTEGFTDFTVDITDAASISFDWDYTLNDIPGYDSFGYLLNGVYTELTDPLVGNQSGTGALAVAVGDVFGFRSYTTDNSFGNNETLITNFMPGFSGQFDPANWELTLLNSDGNAYITEFPGGLQAFDACGIDVIIADVTEVSCADIGTPILVTVFANDASGNFTSCQATINVVDLMAPTLTCHGNTTAPFDPATGLYELPDYIALGDTFATDNCTEESLIILTQTPAAGTQMPATGGTPHIISFTAEDEYGNISTCEFELAVDVVGVQENEILANALALYPNPTTNLVTLENSSQISLETALIYDLNGKLVAEFDLQEMQKETTLDVSNFSSGVFMVKIIGENASTVKRLIKE